MKKEEIDKLGRFIENKDLIGLKEYSKSLMGKEINEMDDIGYAIMEVIEQDIELMCYFKDVAKIQSGARELIVYCTKIDNIRFFVDNKEEYGLSTSFINKMKNRFDERQKQKIELTNEAKRKRWRTITKIGFLLYIIIAISMTNKFIKPSLEIYVIKNAAVTEAEILDKRVDISLPRFPTSKIYAKYKYILNGVEYIQEDRCVVIGARYALDLKNKSNIKIYYYVNKPHESYIYINSSYMKFLTIVVDIITIMSITKIKYIFWNKN